MEKVQISGRDVLEAFAVAPIIRERKPPIKMGYAMQRTLRDVTDAYEQIEDKRNALISMYGTEKEGGEFGVDPRDAEKFKAYQEEWNKVKKEMFEVQVHTVKLSYLEEKEMDFSIGELSALHFMLEDDL